MFKTGKLQEDAYFYQKDRELIEARKQRQREDAERNTPKGPCSSCGHETTLHLVGEHEVVACGHCQGVFIPAQSLGALLQPFVLRTLAEDDASESAA